MYQKFVMLSNSEDFNNFLKNNSWWIAIICAVVIVIAVLAILLPRLLKKEKKPAKPVLNYDDSMNLLGGKDNIVESKINGSRITVILKNYDLVNKEEIEKLGVDRFILMSDRLILVAKENVEEIYKRLFS
ncbi:MAG: hypothetical protein SPL00_04090 [Bacilli bacterium]|nr:hypothetical protein [Bacilli bacterium]